MSYCVNCGVELDPSLTACPLCNTPVINPKELADRSPIRSPFPRDKGQVEAVRRKDLGILVTTVALATAITCGLLNLFVFQGSSWSLVIIGICVMLWVFMAPFVIYSRLSVYSCLLLDAFVVIAYLYTLSLCLGSGSDWFYRLGLPIVLLVFSILELLTLALRRLPAAFLTRTLYIFTAIPLLCVGLEILIDRFLSSHVSLSWSVIVLAVCAIIDIALITTLSRRRLRNAVRRRLHF